MKTGVLIAALLAFAEAQAAERVCLKGWLGDRLNAMVERQVVAMDVDYITAPFLEKTERKGWWQTDFWGKWMHAAVPYLDRTGSARLKASVERGIDRILSSQEPCGYIGNYPDELRCGEGWDVWGMKYTLMGLIHYYDLMRRAGTSRPTVVGSDLRADRILEAAKRLCDYLIAEIGPNGNRGRELWETGNWSGMASSSVLEPVVWLYRHTQDKKYLDFATYIVKGMTEPEAGPRLVDLAQTGVSVADRDGKGYDSDGPWKYVCKRGRCKAYEMMSCYQGILDYVEEVEKVEGDVEVEMLRTAAVKTAEDIVKEEVNLAGGCSCSEAWFHGARKQHLPYEHLQETCVTTTWMRFCEKLLDVTDDIRWADELERTFYNAYLAALKADGSWFASYTPLSGNRCAGQHHCFMHTNCCNANGPRGFLCFLQKLFESDGKTATFNFYASALVKGFDMYSLYPRGNSARIVSHTEGRLDLRFRIPTWCPKAEVKLNGQSLEGVCPGSYFKISRDWRLGDVVELVFEMPVVAHVQDHHVAFTRGPVLLARDSRFADGEMSEPFRRLVQRDGETVPSFTDGCLVSGFESVRTPTDDLWMAFSATLPIGRHGENEETKLPQTVFFCDYASAGNSWTRDNCYRTWFPVERGLGDK